LQEIFGGKQASAASNDMAFPSDGGSMDDVIKGELQHAPHAHENETCNSDEEKEKRKKTKFLYRRLN